MLSRRMIIPLDVVYANELMCCLFTSETMCKLRVCSVETKTEKFERIKSLACV